MQFKIARSKNVFHLSLLLQNKPVCISQCLPANICNQKHNWTYRTYVYRNATMLKIKLLKADGKWWSAGEHGIRVYNSIVWFLRRKTKAFHVFAKRAASIRMRSALLPTRFDDTLLLSSLTPPLYPRAFVARFAHVCACPPRHARLSGGSRSRFIHSQ